MMRKSHNEQHARSVQNPLRVASQAHNPASNGPAVEATHSESQEISSVNPLWMITAGLAAFLILLVAVW
jgi:hypothetical protein